MLINSGNEPSLYPCPVSNILGWVPLIPCFVACNKHLTLQHGIGSHQGSVADTCPDTGNCSRIFEFSPWMWCYWRGQPRKVSVAEAEARRQEWQSQGNQQAVKTLKLCREEQWDEFCRCQHCSQAEEADKQ